MKEYDLFVPLYYNDGSPIEAEKFQALQEPLLMSRLCDDCASPLSTVVAAWIASGVFNP